MSNLLNNPPRLPLIFPSILSADFAAMGDQVADVLKLGADGVHIDVMDGHFAPNLTMGAVMVEALRRRFSDAYLDSHLMVQHPEDYVAPFAKAGSNCFTFHIEATMGRKQDHERDLIKRIRDAGMAAGVAINPPTPAEAVFHLLDEVDLVLVMSVHPGFSGQSFIEDVLDKTRAIKQRLAPTTRLQMDGGVGPTNAASVRRAGCDCMVAASAIFGVKDCAGAIAALRG